MYFDDVPEEKLLFADNHAITVSDVQSFLVKEVKEYSRKILE